MSRRDPEGISQGNWSYIQEPSVAAAYDDSIAGSPVVEQDDALLRQYLRLISDRSSDDTICDFIDFGCGTGRSMLIALEAGWNCVGVDLSDAMLSEARHKLNERFGAERFAERVILVQGNLVDLSFIRPASFDLGVCLFSTFGMIRGRGNRHRFLKCAFDSIRPNGVLLVHGHNIWHQASFPGGCRWLLLNRFKSLFSTNTEFGDRYASTRLTTNLFLHSFTEARLIAEIAAAQFEILAVVPVLDPSRQGRLVRSPIGWVVAARRP